MGPGRWQAWAHAGRAAHAVTRSTATAGSRKGAKHRNRELPSTDFTLRQAQGRQIAQISTATAGSRKGAKNRKALQSTAKNGNGELPTTDFTLRQAQGRQIAQISTATAGSCKGAR
jgi:hypothetical protein